MWTFDACFGISKSRNIYFFEPSSCFPGVDISKVMGDSTSTAFEVVTSPTSLGFSDIGLNTEVVGIPWGQIAIYLLASIIISFGNSLVIAAVLRYEFLQTPTNVFVVGIASLDLTMGLLSMFKIGQLVYVYEGYYTCMIRIGIAVLQTVATGYVLAGMTT